MKNLSLLDVICCAIFCNIVIFKIMSASIAAQEDAGRRFVAFFTVKNFFAKDQSAASTRIVVRISHQGSLLDEGDFAPKAKRQTHRLQGGMGDVRVTVPGLAELNQNAKQVVIQFDGVVDGGTEIELAVSQDSHAATQLKKEWTVKSDALIKEITGVTRGVNRHLISGKEDIKGLIDLRKDGEKLLKEKENETLKLADAEIWRRRVVARCCEMRRATVPDRVAFSHREVVEELELLACVCTSDGVWERRRHSMISEAQEIVALGELSRQLANVQGTATALAEEVLVRAVKSQPLRSDIGGNVQTYLQARPEQIDPKAQWILIELDADQPRTVLQAAKPVDIGNELKSGKRTSLAYGPLFFDWLMILAEDTRIQTDARWGELKVGESDIDELVLYVGEARPKKIAAEKTKIRAALESSAQARFYSKIKIKSED